MFAIKPENLDGLQIHSSRLFIWSEPLSIPGENKSAFKIEITCGNFYFFFFLSFKYLSNSDKCLFPCNFPDDFESKFTFHSVEDFPPPDEFKPFQKIYPSKIARGKCVNSSDNDPKGLKTGSENKEQKPALM